MSDLRLIGRSSDGNNLELESHDGTNFTLPLNDELRTLINQPRLVAVSSKEEQSALTVKEVQARLRGGETIDSISRTTDWTPEKIEKFAQNLGNLITRAIVDPFTALFGAFKNLFFQLYEILIKIGDKITSLPSCTALYMFQSVFGAIDGIYNYFVPAFLVSLISTIYAYTLQYPLSIISEMFGLD